MAATESEALAPGAKRGTGRGALEDPMPFLEALVMPWINAGLCWMIVP
jgi:hypothetical protein